MEFYELPRSSQMGQLVYHSVVDHPSSIIDRYGKFILPTAIYNKNLVPMTTNYESSLLQKNISAILKCLTLEPLCTDMNIYESWGFILEYNRAPLILYKNEKSSIKEVVIINLNSILKKYITSEVQPYTYPPRIKAILAGFAYFAFCSLV